MLQNLDLLTFMEELVTTSKSTSSNSTKLSLTFTKPTKIDARLITKSAKTLNWISKRNSQKEHKH